MIDPARDRQTRVVLLRSIDVIRIEIVGRQVIELRGRLVVDVAEGVPAVQRDIRAAVIALNHPLVVCRIDPEIVVVAVRRGHGSKCAPAIGAPVQIEVVAVNRLRILGIGRQMGVIPGPREQILIGRNLLPGLSKVVRAIESALGCMLDQRPDPARFCPAGSHADLAPDRFRQTEAARDIGPGLATIQALPQSAVRAAAADLPESCDTPPRCWRREHADLRDRPSDRPRRPCR